MVMIRGALAVVFYDGLIVFPRLSILLLTPSFCSGSSGSTAG